MSHSAEPDENEPPHQNSEIEMAPSSLGRSLGALGYVLGAAATLAVLFFSFGFYRSAAVIPAGTSIRPMGLAALYFMVGGGSILFGLPLSLAGLFACRRACDRQGILWSSNAVFLCAAPLPLGLLLFYLITYGLGLNLAD